MIIKSIPQLALITGSLFSLNALAGDQPNILLILSDDQGFCELGAYLDFADPKTLGAKNIDQLKKITEVTDKQAPIDVCIEAARKCMPNVDRIASEGMRFTDFHTAPTCAPSRAALISGQYPQGFGIYSNDDVEGKYGKGMPVEVDVPVRLFREAGYLTGLSGKWHLGDEKGQLPHERGFDFFFGFNRAHTEKYDSKILQRNGKRVPAKGWLADQITDEAIAFLDIAEEQDKPFFLHVSYNEPHGPMPRPPQHYIDAINSGSDVVDVYYGMIYGMDAGIGRILQKLEAMGELDNTVILYASDNGQAQGPYHSGFLVREQAYHVPVPGNGPLQGCKWTPWEGAVRTPFIVRLPGGKKGSSGALLSILDILPTAFELAGIEVPGSMKLDGMSFLPILKGKPDCEWDRTLFWAMDSKEPFGNFGPRDDELLRQVQQMGKVDIRAEKHPPAWYVRTPKWKLMGWDTIDPVLFDMENDISERNDLASEHPEVVKALSAQFRNWFSQQADPLVYPESQWGKLKLIK